MDHTYKYSVLQAIPDPRRGERVNVGIVVFRGEGADVRFTEAHKLKALTSRNFDDQITEYAERISLAAKYAETTEELLEDFRRVNGLIVPSEFGWLSAATEGEYQARVQQILERLVTRPKAEKRPKQSRINTEIAQVFRTAEVLASKDEGLDSHKVVRDFYVSRDEDLKADFALKNGALNVTATLDLRSGNVGIAQAALKAVILDKAKQGLGEKTNRFGVYAMPADRRDHFRSHVELLGDYSDDTFNWLNRDEQKRYKRRMFDAINAAHQTD